MDNSREQDLYLLHARMHDMTISKSKRVSAGQKFESIKAQIRDPKLNNLRSRLVRATAANDAEAVERIGYEIKAYSDRKHY